MVKWRKRYFIIAGYAGYWMLIPRNLGITWRCRAQGLLDGYNYGNNPKIEIS
jgi:hypothetical protein